MVAVWSKTAQRQLQKAYNYIYEESPQNAVLVIDKIIDLTINLCNNPEKHSLDKYKLNNDGSYRAF